MEELPRAIQDQIEAKPVRCVDGGDNAVRVARKYRGLTQADLAK